MAETLNATSTISLVDNQKQLAMSRPNGEQQVDVVNTMTTTSPLVGLVSGCAGAVTLVYVGQPLDTVKVRMQLSTASHAVTSNRGGGVSMWSCVRDMWRQALVVPVSHLNNTTVVGGGSGSSGVVEACSLTSSSTATATQQTNKMAAATRMARLMYAGTGPALLANVAENGVLFAAYGPCQQLISYAMDIFGGGKTVAVEDIEKKLGPTGMAAAGSLASLCSAFALCPTELIKVRLQAADLERSHTTNNVGKSMPPAKAAIGTLQVVASVWKTEGGLRGMYRGLGSTVAREMPGYYVFFLAYEASRTYLSEWLTPVVSTPLFASGGGGGGGHGGSASHNDPAWVTMTAGAAAGTCLWLVVYPIDAIKSRIQASGGDVTKNTCSSSGSFFKTLALSVRNEGPMALYRGLAPTLIRTVPASAVMFWTVERTKTLLSSYGL